MVSCARTKRISKRVQCRGRAGQGGAGTPDRNKISLRSLTDEDVVDAGGVVFKNTIASGCLPACDNQTAMRTAGSNMHRAATALTPLPVQKPPDTRRHAKSLKCLDITSRAPGVCRQSTARARPAAGEEVRGPAHAISGVMQAWGTICAGLNPPVGPRIPGAMAMDGDG